MKEGHARHPVGPFAACEGKSIGPPSMITTLNQKLMLRFPDRVGIVADSAIRIAKLGMNIASIEVRRSDDEAQIFLEVENAAHPDGHGRLAASLERVADLRRFATLKPSRWRSVKTGYGW